MLCKKGLIAQYARNGNQGALGVTGINGADAVGLLKAASDYLQKTKDGSDVLLKTDTTNTISVAAQLDAAIAAHPNPVSAHVVYKFHARLIRLLYRMGQWA